MNETQAQNVYVYFVFGIFVVVAVAFSFCCCFINVSVVWKATRCLRSPYSNLNLCLCVFICVCVCVLCMLPVWLFARWRKPERKRHVCFSFQFIITRYFYDHERSPMWCVYVVCCALHRIDNMSEWIWTALSNYRRIWSKSFLAIFGRVLHTHTRTHTELCLLLFVFISSSSFSIRQTWHLSASMSNIFHSLMGILFYVLFW